MSRNKIIELSFKTCALVFLCACALFCVLFNEFSFHALKHTNDLELRIFSGLILLGRRVGGLHIFEIR